MAESTKATVQSSLTEACANLKDSQTATNPWAFIDFGVDNCPLKKNKKKKLSYNAAVILVSGLTLTYTLPFYCNVTMQLDLNASQMSLHGCVTI